MDTTGKTVVITGASSGIGRALALHLAREGHGLVLHGRDAARLGEVAAKAGAPVCTHASDLTAPGAVEALADAVGKAHPRVDALVHGAGIALVGPVESAPAADFVKQFTINVAVPYALTQALLPMLKAARGHVVFINSRAGLNAYEGFSQYCATKHALRALAESLRQEAAPHGVRVTSVYPGKTSTPMLEGVYGQQGKPYAPDEFMDPSHVAASIAHVLSQAPGVEITDLTIKPQSDLSR